MKNTGKLGLLLLAGAIACSFAQAQDRKETRSDAARGSLSADDARRLETMARADLAEIAAGKVAVGKARSPEVKKFAQLMIDEHTKMLDEGGKLARSKGVQPPSSPDQKHEAALKKLEGLSGDAFDRSYMAQMVSDHREALKLVKDTASNARDADLKAMAQKASTHVQEHLKMAEQIAGKTKSTAGAPGEPGAQFARSGDAAHPASGSSTAHR